MYAVQEDGTPRSSNVQRQHRCLGMVGYEKGYGANNIGIEPDSNPSRPHQREL